MLKDYVIPDPDIQKLVRTPEDMYVVLATDGLWDVFTNNQVAKLLHTCEHPQKGAEMLARKAFSLGSTDNITVLVVDVRQNKSNLDGAAAYNEGGN